MVCVIGLLISGKIAQANLNNNDHNITVHENDELQKDIGQSINITAKQFSHLGTHDASDITQKQNVTYDLLYGISLGILDGLACTGMSIITKKLQPEIENIFILAVYYNITGLLVSLILMLAIEIDRIFFPTDVKNIIFFTIHSTSTLISSFTLQIAFYFGSAVTIALTINANLPLNVLCEYVLFRSTQPLSGGNPIELTGVGIVTLGVALCPLLDFIEHCSSKRHVISEQESLLDQRK